jgi:CDP-diacylglycerol---glycerol-3-phosphate 3-phosphatidyltransferase
MSNKPIGALKKVPRILTLRFKKRKRLRDFKTKELGDEIGSIPNLVTFSRLVLIPFILYFLQMGTVKSHYIAGCLFLLAGISDGLDGFLARILNKSTLMGKFLDPLADKLTTLSVMVYLSIMMLVPPWLLILMLFREFSITGLRAIASGEGVIISASNSGKVKTAFQFVGLTFLLAHHSYRLLGTSIVLDYHLMGLYILYLSLVMSFFSAFEYFALFVEAVELKNIKKKRMLEKAAMEAGLPPEFSSNPSITVCEELQLDVELDEKDEE